MQNTVCYMYASYGDITTACDHSKVSVYTLLTMGVQTWTSLVHQGHSHIFSVTRVAWG